MNESPPLITANPAAGVKGPKPDPKEKRTLRPAAMAQFVEHQTTSRYDPMLTLILATGVRVSEACGWQWRDYDANAKPKPTLMITRRLHWTSGVNLPDGSHIEMSWKIADVKKTKSRRLIPLGTTASAALRAIAAQQEKWREALGDEWPDHGFILTNIDGEPVVPRNLQRALDEKLRQLGLPHRSLHDLRKTSGTFLARQGVPMHVVQDWLGHEKIDTTASYYLEVIEDDLSRAADNF